MLVGILESKNDRFMRDVMARLEGVSAEYVSLGAEGVPLKRDYRVLVDRLSFCHPYLREVAKSLSLGGAYVINNPFAASATNKIQDTGLGSRLGLSFPRTIMLPDRRVIEATEGGVGRPDLGRVAEEIGLPCVLKPYDGYAWEDVYVVSSAEELENLYVSLSSRHVLLAQRLIRFTAYYRVFCFDRRDVLFVKWIPRPLGMGQYLLCPPGDIGEARDRLTSLTIQLNEALGLDVNVVEWCVDGEGKWWVIDAFNEVPEVIPEMLPPEYYSWIVDRLVACIRDKLTSGKRNRTPFSVA